MIAHLFMVFNYFLKEVKIMLDKWTGEVVGTMHIYGISFTKLANQMGMVRIEQGGEYTAKRFRSGTGDKGDWELVVVKAEGKARQELVIFPTNIPSGITEGGTFRVDNIRSVEIRVQKNPDGTWGAEKTRVEAEVTAIVYDDLDDLYSGDFDL